VYVFENIYTILEEIRLNHHHNFANFNQNTCENCKLFLLCTILKTFVGSHITNIYIFLKNGSDLITDTNSYLFTNLY